MSLKDTIHQLTNEHMTHGDDGGFHKAPPLLAELRAACGSNMGAQGGGSGGMGMIVNHKAVKLENDIKSKALAEHLAMTGNEYRGGLVDLLHAWSTAASTEWQPYLEGVTQTWINDIKEMLVSKRPPWRPSIPCPACGQRFYGPEREPCLAVHHWDEDADEMAPPSQWTANCDGCKAEWSGDELKWLRAASNTPTANVAEVAEVN
ncbi:hypothetical protein DM793_18705 [Paenarthrobacter nitroguajacolicus]|uniref:hypothetical protein n=1 Tax=Paenarthrobacter nitroguajacolicus TaxID=211146 RepID=UPI0015BCFA7A|nr:hypothetical protein [Paenarthrobacter nitroguajacolicus]NWL13299.1 hypothetical protein [Paenarthrobacter nitroguajacolicus]